MPCLHALRAHLCPSVPSVLACAHLCPGSGLLCSFVLICVLFPSPRSHRCSPVPCPDAPVLTCAVTRACRVCRTLWRGPFRWAVAHTDGCSTACLSEALSGTRRLSRPPAATVPFDSVPPLPELAVNTAQLKSRVLWPAALRRLGAILWTCAQTAGSALTAHHVPTAFAPSRLRRRRKGRGGERRRELPRACADTRLPGRVLL